MGAECGVDEVIAHHFESRGTIKPVNTLKAILVVAIDDKTDPDIVVISCTDNGRGFTPGFLESVDTLEQRKIYTGMPISNKISAAKALSDIPLYTGGKGQGLRMLIRKIDEGTYLDPDRKNATKFYKAPISDIFLSNKLDSSGKIAGAVITVMTSKNPVVKAQPQHYSMVTPAKKVNSLDEARELMHDTKQKTKAIRESPTSITMELDYLNEPSEKDDGKDDFGSFSPRK